MDEYCFVIQPFDNGKFDKRYYDIFKPAIEAAGLIAYRVDEDETVEIPIDTIEEKIKSASICLADITLNNPNVWYEVGFAFASGKTTILLCSDEREGNSYPFDIRQRNVTSYKTESQSDFDKLKSTITSKIRKLKKADIVTPVLSIKESVDNIDGLSYQEVSFIASVLAVQDMPDEIVSAWGIKEHMKKIGLNELAFNICVRKLLAKKFIELSDTSDYNGNEYRGIEITENGSTWILQNEDKFSSSYEKTEEDSPTFDDNLPFK